MKINNHISISTVTKVRESSVSSTVFIDSEHKHIVHTVTVVLVCDYLCCNTIALVLVIRIGASEKYHHVDYDDFIHILYVILRCCFGMTDMIIDDVIIFPLRLSSSPSKSWTRSLESHLFEYSKNIEEFVSDWYDN